MMNFELLAAAYLKAPKKAHSKPQREPKRIQAKENTTAPQKAEEKPQEAPQPDTLESELFSTEDVKRLSQGVQVVRQDERHTTAYFTTPLNARQTMIFKLESYYHENTIHAGQDAKFTGFIQDGKAYTDFIKLQSAYNEDIENALRELIPDEETALTKVNRESVQFYLDNDWTNEAIHIFLEGKEPSFWLYSIRKEASTAVLMNWMLDRKETSKTTAEAIINTGYDAKDIAEKIIKYNRVKAIYDSIKADKSHPAHNLKRIMESITDEKTVKVELENGATVKVDAGSVKRIGFMGWISEFSVAASDRNKLPRDKYNRPDDIKPEQIKAIYHGQKTLYKA